MVHLRAFSFTDDSANIAFCSTTNGSDFLVPSPRKHLLPALDPALQLLEFRQIQSAWYQDLFQSSRQGLEEPWQYLCSALHNMHSWEVALPLSTESPIKKLFRLEVLYSSILLLSPSPSIERVYDYNKALIFKFAIDYAETVSSSNEGSERSVFHTFHDLKRTAFVGKAILGVLQETPNQILSGVVPSPPSNLKSIVPPPLTGIENSEVLSQAIACLERLDKVLEASGTRFGYPSLHDEFRVQSCNVQRMLHARRNGRAGFSGNEITQDSRTANQDEVFDINRDFFWSPAGNMMSQASLDFNDTKSLRF